jgi:hypothetical protein
VTSTDPLGTFGELPEGDMGPAFSFAMLAETLAIGSIALFVAMGALAAAPKFAARVLSNPAVIELIAGAIVLVAAGMVALHALWGICLELGVAVSGGKARFRLGMRFGLYACGWDLLTSPAGILQGVVSRGFARAWEPIGAATRAPGAAMRAYQRQRRRLDRTAERRGVQLSVVILGGTMLLLIIASLLLVGYIALRNT